MDEKEFWRLIDAARDRIGTADHAFDQPDLEGAEDPKAGFIRVGSQRCFTAQNRLYRRCQLLVPVREAETELLALQVWVEVLEGAPSFTRAEQSRLNGRLANRLPGLADIGEQVAIVQGPEDDRTVVLWPAADTAALRARALDREGARQMMAGLRAAEAFRAFREAGHGHAILLFRGQEWIPVDSAAPIDLDDLVMLTCLQCRTLSGTIVGSLQGSCPVCAQLPHHACELRGLRLTLSDAAAKSLGATRIEVANGGVADASGPPSTYSRVDLNGQVQRSDRASPAPRLRVHQVH